YPDEGYTLYNLLSGLFNFDSPSFSSKGSSGLEHTQELQCPQCGMTFADFKHKGKFGCAHCYDTFADRLDPIFRRVHSGNTRHHGKIPKRKGGSLHVKKQLEKYKLEMQRLVEKEAFEEAAEIRDKIKSLEKEMTQKETGDDA